MKTYYSALTVALSLLFITIYFIGCDCKQCKAKNTEIKSDYKLVIVIVTNGLKDTLTIDYKATKKEEPNFNSSGNLWFLDNDRGDCKCKLIATDVSYYKILSNEIYNEN